MSRPTSNGDLVPRIWIWRDKHGALQASREKPADELDAVEYCPIYTRQQISDLAHSDEGVDTDVYVTTLRRVTESQRRHIARLEAQFQARPDAEAIAAAPSLRDKKAVVLYFETDADRDEVVELLKQVHPDMRAVNV